ncbi:hypothetical protein C8R43DRAFT_313998 [Mycena crocata]|nr:hypothetical protein C8R43DRAFT_313998 [Mycena crocata]
MAKIVLFMFCALLWAHACAAFRPNYGGNLSVPRRRDEKPISTPAATTATFTFEIPFDEHGSSFSEWIGVVCLRPDQMTEDECELQGDDWFQCPNPDVSGILVRVPTYLVNLLLGIVVMYNPNESSDAVWTQLLTVYALLVSGAIAIATHGISRFHSGQTVLLVMSPLSIALFVYAILGFLGRRHRLDNILSAERKNHLPRILVVIFPLVAFALMIFTSIAPDNHFTKTSPCDFLGDKGAGAAIIYNFLFIPYVGVAIVLLTIVAILGPTAAGGHPPSIAIMIGSAAPVILVTISFVFAIIRTRKALSEQLRQEKGQWKFWVLWNFLGRRYPFLHFCGVFLIPMIYWVIANEMRLLGTPDNIFSLSFGQVLASFVILPPLLQVLKMTPAASRWFRNLAVIRLLTGRQRELVLPVGSRQQNDEIIEMASLTTLEK